MYQPDPSMQPQPSMGLPGAGLTLSIGGIMPVRNLRQLQAEDKARAAVANSKPYITNLASHVRNHWQTMRDAKQLTAEPRMLKCLRQRRGEYDEDIKALIAEQGGSSIYMMLCSNKARAVSSWIRDVMTDPDSGAVPYNIVATPVPELPPDQMQAVAESLFEDIQAAAQAGVFMTRDDLEQYVNARKEMALNELREEASAKADAMKRKMDDQFTEGDMQVEFSGFIDDLATFPFAVMKGPVVKKRKSFAWKPAAKGGFTLALADQLLPTWERIDPFMLYWSPHSSHPDDGDIIERHRLARADLLSLVGVEGYSEDAIRAVLEDYSTGRLDDWLYIDSAKAVAEGKSLSGQMINDTGLIDALQYWGSVQGQLLIDYGMDTDVIDDPLQEYPVEIWVVGTWVIKATINPDPLGRKPYFKCCYEEIPGSWMGNSPMDLTRDCGAMCNASARALANNMGIASGPQVWVNVDRLPPGENIAQLTPWKLWQFTSDLANTTAQPMGFFQPNSMAQELMAVYEHFSVLADEYSGIPRYMTGDGTAGGAGRTATGMHMMMDNASKSIKQVISNIDRFVIQPLVGRLWFYNMRYADDPELQGDVKLVARGASALLIKEAAAQRRNELLQIALNSPVAQQIMGVDGTAQLMREQIKTLDLNVDRIIPDPEIVKARALIQRANDARMQAQAAIQQAQLGQPAGKAPGQPGQPGQSGQRPPGPMTQSTEQLPSGMPVADTFSPMSTRT